MENHDEQLKPSLQTYLVLIRSVCTNGSDSRDANNLSVYILSKYSRYSDLNLLICIPYVVNNLFDISALSEGISFYILSGYGLSYLNLYTRYINMVNLTISLYLLKYSYMYFV